MSKRARRKYDPHVRLYGWELQTAAYRTLSPDARALLVEFRALYSGKENRIFLSVRQMQERLGGVGQRRATHARDQLLERGWIKLIEAGGFTRKVRHAAVYRLTNEPETDAMGSATTKEYVRWQPAPRKNTVAKMATVGSRGSYSGCSESTENATHGSQIDYRQPILQGGLGSHGGYTDKLPPARAPALASGLSIPGGRRPDLAGIKTT